MESIEKIKSTYSRIAEEAQQESNKIQQAIYHTGSLRLLLFVAGIAGIIYFREESWTILAGIALVTLLPFILLIKYHNNLFRRKDYQEKRAEVNRQELAALDYDTSCFDAGEEFVDPAHLYAYDLDVFGTHSLFQYVNRTCTEPGKRLLANWLGQHLEKKEDILIAAEDQAAKLKELEGCEIYSIEQEKGVYTVSIDTEDHTFMIKVSGSADAEEWDRFLSKD